MLLRCAHRLCIPNKPCNMKSRLFGEYAQYSPIVRTTISFLQQINVKVNYRTVNEALQNHPDHDSLLAISDSLKKWKVDNLALNVDPKSLPDIPLPFITQLRNKGGDFVVVEKIADETITYQSPNSPKPIHKPVKDFLAGWKPVVLVAESSEESGETDYDKTRRKLLLKSAGVPLAFVYTLAITTLIYFFGNLAGNFAAYAVLLVLKLTGLLVTAFLLWYDIDKKNPFLQKICSGIPKTNCSAILNSRQSKLFNWLSWSEVGFFYFFGTFALVLLSSLNPVFFTVAAWLNVLALPYTIFSVYYQGRVAKQWCVLCLTVQALLVLEFINSISFGLLQPFAITPGAASLAVLCLLCAPILWNLLKNVFQRALNFNKLKTEHLRFKYNYDIFDSLLQKQNPILGSTDNLGIVLGNPQGSIQIVKVCNPYCGPCAAAHPVLENLIKENQDVKVRIIFTATTDENDFRKSPVKHLLALNRDHHTVATALDDWYLAPKKNYQAFAARYPLNGELEQQEDKIKAMETWCRINNISFTPTFYLNGRQLPSSYNVGDLKYFLAM